ncbi:NAD-specific glutamate dehydrogenase [Candidatus Terasakiella magnetica]|uniref:NAD-specific glutamate dehydrogenase n=1 Tax=Candidatus Terasakiella magnetica TaxID=1867952 RepID=A0A1C3REZ1_9PROT|nr:NAD-glutamate dehydrogenase [Candidatus Terasakiella magnetica]SCA55825.1 NAD-specific glutamate dehydrogenase [Candidatus Terasakiella magnetica]
MNKTLSKSEQQKADLINKVAKLINDRLPKAEKLDAEKFVRQFFEKVPPRDLIGRNEEEVYGSALAFWRFAYQRQSEESLIRVYNPNLEEHGWQSDHTVVEICTTDRPFLVDSIASALAEHDMTIYLTIHPVIQLCREEDGRLRATCNAKEVEICGKTCAKESFMLFLVNRHSNMDHLQEIHDSLTHCLEEGNAAVRDWLKMRDFAQETTDHLTKKLPNAKSEEYREFCDFMQWVHDDHFTFLGACDFEIKGKTVVPVMDGALGILSNPKSNILDEISQLATSPASEKGRFTEDSTPIMLAKTSHKSMVHRPVYMDVVCIKRYGAKGKVIGQRVFVGLFTSAAYSRAPHDIPLMRMKSSHVMQKANFEPSSHNRKALAHIIDTFPRDELFQISEDDLYEICMGVLHLQERQRVALFVRQDDFKRFASCQIYIPRDSMTTELRHLMQDILERAFNGEVMAFYTQIGDAPLARLHVIVSTPGKRKKSVDIFEVESQLIDAARNWPDQLRDQLVTSNGEEKGLEQFRRYGSAFPAGYIESHNAAVAVSDITKLDDVIETGELQLSLYRPIEAAQNVVRFKLYHPNKAVPLSHVLPMLENMGLLVLDEHPYPIKPSQADMDVIMMHDFGLETSTGEGVDLSAIRKSFQEAFRHVWNGSVENDGFNRLVIQAGIQPWPVMLLRALCKYLRQANIPFSQTYMQRALAYNPQVTRLLIDLFYEKFDPERQQDDKKINSIRSEILDILDSVQNADEDRILRRFLNLIDCTLRTNYFQKERGTGEVKNYVSFKFNSMEIEDLPLPRPWREIFVYSPRIEGVHLRGGPVARGGLRWSDRREDFRTEILGLVKAQQVKNAVIVPVGSKGGFVVKQPPNEGGRDAFISEGIECYITFIRGLLDLTDNYISGKVIPPQQVIRHDDDDPYLVVAADKGTATFSDIANRVSEEYGHWLGDAFASGGSVGYDHKKMGITAKGAWESVKRHFREIGKDIQTQDFTAVGVGDMGGDVFGNGMLLSKHIRLVAAFNHMHIFIDPNPDSAKSWEERKRLFDAVKGWDHYDTSLISKGGGIFERSAKQIDITPEIRKALSLPKNTKSLSPSELIRAILKSEIELLWFGGIGTYIKESHESDADTGDRGNDAIRIDAPELRCQVIGEGANLGCTQKGRIEYALHGGRNNTDAIDNSAGVDCSDHEVNIKILVNQVVADGDMTTKQRNKLLEQMTDEVSELVLRDNYLQSQAITMIHERATDLLDQQARLMKYLERNGRLDRDVEVLPNDEVLAERQAAQKGLTRPEISVLMPYAKIWLYDQLLESKLPDDPRLEEDLIRYFPSDLQQTFESQITKHMLRREIIATHITNSLINRVGGTFVTQTMENTNATPDDIARAYLITRDSFGLRETWEEIEALDNKVSAQEQVRMLIQVNRLIDRGTKWFLRNCEHPIDIGKTVEAFSDGLQKLGERLEDVLPENVLAAHLNQAQTFIDNGVPEKLAKSVAGKVVLVSGCDIVGIAHSRDMDVVNVSKIYFAVGARFDLGWMRATGEQLGLKNHWQKLAVGALIEDLYTYQSTLTYGAIEHHNKGADALDGLEKWIEQNQTVVDQTDQMLAEMKTTPGVDFAMLTVAAKQLRDMISQ